MFRIIIYILFLSTLGINLNAQTSEEKLSEKELKKLKKLEKKDFSVVEYTKYQYDESGKLTEGISFNEEEGKLQFYYKDTYTYNETDSIEKITRYSKVDNKDELKLEETFFKYYKNRFKYSEVKKIDGELVDSIHYNEMKDKDDLLLSEMKILYKEVPGGVRLFNVDNVIYEYDENQNIIRKTYSSHPHHALMVVTNTYNEQNQLMELHVIDYNQTKAPERLKYQYEYDDNGNMYKQIQSNLDKADKTETIRSQYNKENQQVEEKYFREGELASVHQFEYDKEGRLKKWEKYFLSFPTKTKYIWYFNYDENNRHIETIVLSTR